MTSSNSIDFDWLAEIAMTEFTMRPGAPAAVNPGRCWCVSSSTGVGYGNPELVCPLELDEGRLSLGVTSP